MFVFDDTWVLHLDTGTVVRFDMEDAELAGSISYGPVEEAHTLGLVEGCPRCTPAEWLAWARASGADPNDQSP